MNGIKPFSYCLNTSTIRGQGLSLPAEIELCAQAGYDGIEPWIREIDAYTSSGGSLAEVCTRILDAGLVVPNIIGFFTWAVDDDLDRAAGLEEARRNMEICTSLDCSYIAAPPYGVTDVVIPLSALVERYVELLELGKQMGVVPMIEFWGISQTLQRLSEAVAVALQVGDKSACVLADVFHMAKGGSPFEGLLRMNPDDLGLLHINDYPDKPLDELSDADRIYPGDGVAPLLAILSSLHHIGYHGALSIELFNQAYWQQSALQVAKIALEKTQRLVNDALRRM